ncbi:MAG: FtsW/RodA/SpoVE family cell cycle protein [Bacteroidales bacterium]|nr:FtsW/RodA/SpoVE family cell cycle protein [Bacteroidales bacterium]
MKAILGKLQGDRVIWFIVAFLSLFSILAVYSSTGTLAYRYQAGNTEYYLIKHLIIVVMGFFMMFIAHKIKYTYYSRLSQLALIVAVPLLVITLMMGTNINEANRWLTLPVINITFQSSDFAKLALIIYIARMLTKKQDRIKDLKSAFLPIILPVVIVCAFILPANLSTAIILFATSVVLMFIGRVSIKYIMALVFMGVVLMGLFIVILMNSPDTGRLYTWKNRVENFVGKEGDTYQTDQAKIAIATGGVTGKMPGNSVQRNFLPQAYSDFIYAIIIEEYGIIGGFTVLFLYLILLFRGVRIAHRSPGTFGALLAIGLTFSLVFQAMINMAVTVGLLPVTGQPLPMVSMGGTSMWFTSLAIGIILSVSRKVEEIEDVKEGGEYVPA